jgi:hypothetical protein
VAHLVAIAGADDWNRWVLVCADCGPEPLTEPTWDIDWLKECEAAHEAATALLDAPAEASDAARSGA